MHKEELIFNVGMKNVIQMDKRYEKCKIILKMVADFHTMQE